MKNLFEKLKIIPSSERLWVCKQIFEHVCSKKYESLLSENFASLTKDQIALLEGMIDDHILFKKPWAYILGHVEYQGLRFKVQEPILIPRPETEELIEKACATFSAFKNDNLNILDIGTGSGFIAISLAKFFPQAQVVGVDILDKAIDLARNNADLNGVKNVKFIKSDLFENLSGLKFDFIISNPPYISESDYLNLEDSVRIWESKHALVAQDDGMKIIKQILNDSKMYLKSNSQIDLKDFPKILLEIGFDQKNKVLSLKDNFYTTIKVEKDSFGKDRFAIFGK